jgi:hypothetical protein
VAEDAMERDPRVVHAAAHWGPRLTVNGVAFSDFHDVTASLNHWDGWCDAFSARAKVHEDMGRSALAAGDGVSAGEHLMRASVTYHFAKYLFAQDMAQLRAAHAKAVDCLTLALPHVDPPAGLDRLCPPEDARRLASEIPGPVELLVIEDGNHVAHNRAYKYRPQSADWMARQLGHAGS